MKYLISLLISINFLNASMLLDTYSTCIEDYYAKNNIAYVQLSSNGSWYALTDDGHFSTIIPNYTYDVETGRCNPDVSLKLGLTTIQFNFLLGVVGLIFGAVFMFFIIQIFTMVGGRR
ncbi:MAG: hypothetical protein AB7D38_07900 [Sulfurimonas sp.]|uniref:hypothetical protein n=1 Tax=Sulfurimonas sp. TaxID=2022749 RepID=UPI003D0F8FBB